MKSGGRLPGLDGIRAISIAQVIILHLTENMGRAFSGLGEFGVDSFFVVSGFLITWLLCQEEAEHGAFSLPAFYARRALRILPPATVYLAVLCVLAVFDLVHLGPFDVFGSLLFLRNFRPGGCPQTVHYWTLAVEEQFYLMWPLLMLLLRSNRARLKACAILMAAYVVWTPLSARLAGGVEYLNHGRFDQRCGPILVGCFLALMRFDEKFLPLVRSRWLHFPGFPLLAAAGVILLPQLPHEGDKAGYVAVGLLINYVVDHPGGPLNWGPVVWLGKLSYSLYLWQQLFLFGWSRHWIGQFPQNVVAGMVAACISYYLIELPFAEQRKKVRAIPNPGWLARFYPVPLHAPAE